MKGSRRFRSSYCWIRFAASTMSGRFFALRMPLGAKNFIYAGSLGGRLSRESRKQRSDPKIPFYIFTEENAKDAGTPPQLSQGYGDAYVKGYGDLWKLQ